MNDNLSPHQFGARFMAMPVDAQGHSVQLDNDIDAPGQHYFDSMREMADFADSHTHGYQFNMDDYTAPGKRTKVDHFVAHDKAGAGYRRVGMRKNGQWVDDPQ